MINKDRLYVAMNFSANTLLAGHLRGDSLVDYFYNAEDDSMTKLQSKRVQTRNTHGTGYNFRS